MKSLNWKQIHKLITLYITTEPRHLKQNEFKDFVSAVIRKASEK